MAKIIFKHLDIRNFKGITSLQLDFQPTVTCIMGANHTGKTTTADAILWVLFGKNSAGLTVFGIDPKDENNQIIHHLDNSVELSLAVDDKDVVLRKVRSENWVKPHGQEQPVLTGHTVDCFIDGEKTTAKDYTDYINTICKESLFKAITSPDYFPTLKVDAQRALLIKMVGVKSLAQIAEGNKQFAELVAQLSGDNEEAVARHREHLAYLMKQVKDQLATIPPRLDENSSIVKKLKSAGTNYDFIRRRIKEIDKGISNYDAQLRDATAALNINYDKLIQLRTVINELKSQLLDIQQDYERRNRIADQQRQTDIDTANAELQRIERQIKMAEDSRNDYTEVLQQLASHAEDFRSRWAEVEDMQFQFDESLAICPTCGQRLPDGDIASKRQELQEHFNLHKAFLQDQLDAEAAQMKTKKSRADAMIDNARATIEGLQASLIKAKQAVAGAQSVVVGHVNYLKDKKYIELSQLLSEAQKKLEAMANAPTAGDNSAELTAAKQKLSQTRDELMQQLAGEKQLQECEARIAELEQQQVTLNQQLTTLEQQDDVALQLEHASIADLEARVNALFPSIRFKMFEQLINQSVRPTCTLTMHGVPYADLSNSEKILAGLECIRAMQQHTATYAPVTIDNCESVNRFPDNLPCQLLLLYVSTDKQLTIVKDFPSNPQPY